MRVQPDFLINGTDSQLWPSRSVRASSNRVARLLAASDWVLRDKRDGRYLAALGGTTISPLVPATRRTTKVADSLELLARLQLRRDAHAAPAETAAADLRHCRALGIADDYGERHALAPVGEPVQLTLAGFDRYRRPLWLQAAAARAWQAMQRSACRAGVQLDAVSGFRSAWYQRGIIERKLSRGQSLERILSVNTAPGYSEHHSGRALDISCAGEPAAELSFDRTSAFRWLQQRAAGFGFRMSYPPDNPHGVIYEPWHWCWQPPEARRPGTD